MLHISHNKQLLTILSRMEQSKGCTATSRTPFANAPPRQLGPRSYLLCSSDSEYSRGKTLVFPRLKQFLALPLYCLTNFCKTKKCQLMPLLKIFQNICTFLLFLCPGTILTPSCQTSSSLHSSCGSVGAASSHPFSHSTTAPTPSCAVDHAPSPSELGPGTRLSPSAASRLAWPWTPRLAARVAVAERRVHTQAVLQQPSGSHFQTSWFLHLHLWRLHETVPEPISYPARRFLHAQDWRRHHRCHRRGTHPINGHRHRGWSSDLFSSWLRPELRGSPVDTCLHPWRRSDQRPVGCTPITLYCTCI
jgi:hypothetical protein